MGEQKGGERGRLHRWWLSFSLNQKIRTFAGAVIFTIMLAILVNVVIVNFALYGFGDILNDNVKSHGFQEAMERESEAFETYVRKKSAENQAAYEAACAATKAGIDALPFTYREAGEERYAMTWSIHNAYGEYSAARDEFVRMKGIEADYVTSLYRIYHMQNYLGIYARRLVQLTLEQGNRAYLVKVPILNQVPYWLLAFGVALIAAILCLTRMMRKAMITPVEYLAQVSRRIAKNDFSGEDIVTENRDEIGDLVQAFNKMKHATVGYITALEDKHEMAELLHKEELGRMEMEKILEATRLEVLKSQINPHFLFNTLNMISCMAKLEDAETTERMINCLSSLFRYNLKTTETEVPLSQELKIVDAYMYLQQMRFGGRIRYEKSIRVDENVLIPSFSLQPIVENAIIHGLSKKEQGGRIYIRAWEQDRMVVISVADSGVGMDAARLRELKDACRERKTSKIGIGLGNIYKRLHMMYEGADLELYSRAGAGTVIQMKIPRQWGETEEKRDVSDTDSR